MGEGARLRTTYLMTALLSGATLIGTALFLRTDESTEEPVSPTKLEESTPANTPAVVDTLRVEAPTAASATPSAREATGAPSPPASTEASAAADESTTILGRIIVAQANGAEVPTAFGSIECTPIVDNMGVPQTVNVLAGTFTMQIPSRTRMLIFSHATLDHRRAVISHGNRLEAPFDTPLVLHAHFLSPLTLRVRDDDSRLDLSSVEIVSQSEWSKAHLEIPDLATARTLVEHAASPVVLEVAPPDDQMITLYATAPGYTWGRLKLDPSAGGEHSIFLRHAGELDLTVLGNPPSDVAEVRLRRENSSGSQPLYETAFASDTPIRITGLLPGMYEIRVELGPWYKQPRILGTAKQEVVAGTTAFTTLTLAVLETPSKVPFRGKLIVPEGWDPSNFWLRISPVNGVGTEVSLEVIDREDVAGNPRVLEFDAGLLEPALYKIELDPTSFSVTHDLVAPGETNFRLELPIPGKVILRVVERSTGQPAKLAQLFWNCERPAQVEGGGLESVLPNSDGTLFEFEAPTGNVEFTIIDRKYETHVERVRVAAGVNEFTIELVRACGVRLTLRNGTRSVAWQNQDQIELVATSSKGSVRSSSSGGNDSWRAYTVSAPGRYRVTLSEIPGYEPIAPFEIEIEPESVVEHEIALTPRR